MKSLLSVSNATCRSGLFAQTSECWPTGRASGLTAKNYECMSSRQTEVYKPEPGRQGSEFNHRDRCRNMASTEYDGLDDVDVFRIPLWPDDYHYDLATMQRWLNKLNDYVMTAEMSEPCTFIMADDGDWQRVEREPSPRLKDARELAASLIAAMARRSVQSDLHRRYLR